MASDLRGDDRFLRRTYKGLSHEIISLLHVGGVDVGSLEPLSAFKATELAVLSLSIQGVTAFQACNGFGDLLADQISEKARFMTG
jgi:hypothetical protein